MSQTISATGFHGESASAVIDKIIDNCPICHKNVTPTLLGSYLNGEGSESVGLQMVYKCPNSKCGSIFFAFYEGRLQSGSRSTWYFLQGGLPSTPKIPNLADTIREISPTFCEIYKQACRTEELGLNEICGMGYRKALEFLVKDFIIKHKKIKKEKIIKTSLGNCIEKYIEDPTTQSVAKRAAWLGNDETHYYRRWEDRNLTDLKNLLHLTINAIDNQILAAQYIQDMSDKSGKEI